MAKLFKRESPPKGGKALKLWRMFTNTELPAPINKPKGEPPDYLCSICPGRNQRSAGAAEYDIQWGLHDFTVYEADDTLNCGMKPERVMSYGFEWYL